MSFTLSQLLMARFWRFFFITYILIGLIWVFSISVRVFIRQEAYTLQLLALVTLRSLPSILPYITCLAAMLTIINMGKSKELQLTTLMGLSRQKRFLHFFPLWILFILMSFYFEGFIKPNIRVALKNPELLMSNNLFQKLKSGMELSSGGWILGSDPIGNLLLVQDNKDKSPTVLLSKGIELDAEKNLIAKDGYLWTSSKLKDDYIKFKSTQISLNREHHNSAKETNFFQLDTQQIDHRHQAAIILRNSLAPFFLMYLGFALGYYGLKIKRGLSFLICLSSLLLLYLPLQILGRSIKTEHLSSHILILSLPFIACIALGHCLNLKAERNGVC